MPILSLASLIGKSISSILVKMAHNAIASKQLMLVGSGSDVNPKNTVYPKDIQKAPKNAFFISNPPDNLNKCTTSFSMCDS